MFLDFTEGSLLWDWSRSQLGIVAFVTSIMVAFIIVSARHDTYSGRILAFLSVAAVLLTLPLSLAQMGIASDMMGTRVVVELGLLGFVLAIVCVALPALLRVLFHSINPELAGQSQSADIYGPYDAQEIFDTLWDGALLTRPLKMDITFYCKKCYGMASARNCPHDSNDRINITGTEQREMLSSGTEIPPEFSRPEVVSVLREYYQSLKP